MTIKAQDIATLVELFETSQWDEMHVEVGGLQLFLSTDPQARLGGGAETQRKQEAGVAVTAPEPKPATHAPAAFVAQSAESKAAAATADVPPHWIAVTAPNLGTFYRAPKPGAAPFVEVGQAVEAASDVCLLEVMKLFTTVTAGSKGTIRRVCANDADMVEFGQTLFFIDPT